MARALLLVALASWVSAAARAQEPTSASDWLTQALSAEHHARPREAVEAYQHVILVAPGSRYAARARTRIAWLEARSTNDYAPLAMLLAFQERPRDERTADVLAAFESATDAMPAGTVRAESRLALASEWSRLGDTPHALHAWQAALDDPDASESQRDLIRESMARARMHDGDLDGALAELDDAALGSIALHGHLQREIRARTWVPVSYGIFAAFVLAVLALVARSGQAGAVLRSLKDAPLRPILALVLGFGPFAIVSWWGDDSIDAFAAFAPCAFVIVLLSFVAGEATETRGVRLAVGALAIAAALATAYASVAGYGEALPFA